MSLRSKLGWAGRNKLKLMVILWAIYGVGVMAAYFLGWLNPLVDLHGMGMAPHTCP